MSARVSLISAMARNRVIGVKNTLPWDYPEDMKFFRDKTKGHPVIMGRKTFESMPSALPGRPNLVVTRKKDYRAEGAEVFSSLQSAIEAGRKLNSEEVYVIGGAEIYRVALEEKLADRIYLTVIDRDYEGDTFFPEIPPEFSVSEERKGENLELRFLTYDR